MAFWIEYVADTGEIVYAQSFAAKFLAKRPYKHLAKAVRDPRTRQRMVQRLATAKRPRGLPPDDVVDGVLKGNLTAQLVEK